MDKRKFNGGHSTKGVAGRKPKSEEIRLIERLTPMANTAYQKLLEGVEAGDFKFIKLFFEYYAGKPRETKDITISKEQPLFNINFDNIVEDIDEDI